MPVTGFSHHTRNFPGCAKVLRRHAQKVAMSSNRVRATTSSQRKRTRPGCGGFPGGRNRGRRPRAARAVPKIVEIGIAEFEIVEITADERSQADVGRDQVDDDDLSQEGFQERRVFRGFHECSTCRQRNETAGPGDARGLGSP